MSVESDLVAELLTHVPLATLVGTRISPDKVVQGAARPYIVYIVKREPMATIDGNVRSTRYMFSMQCWADTRDVAESVADALGTALAACVRDDGIPVDTRETLAEHELDLEGTEIAFEFWHDQ
jgi:hypothetical protein